MEGRFRFLSYGSVRYGVSHESNTLASSTRCESAYGYYDAVWNSAFIGLLILGTKSIWRIMCDLTRVTGWYLN